MPLDVEAYVLQRIRWPASGRHVLAQYDAETIVVYQAYRPEIGHYAAEHGKFGAGFSFSRMTWIKPNFLWMMHRSGWGTKQDQEVTLAIRVRRDGFEAILGEAVPSAFEQGFFQSEQAWKDALDGSSVRLQWDPDHDPGGAPVERRAIQLGVGGATLGRLANEWIVSIEDVSALVASQRQRARSELLVPKEREYPVPRALRARLGME